jgi:protein-tyrosine phosphatase
VGEGGPAGRLAALVAAAPRARSARGAVPDDDVEDPYRRPDAAYARALALIEEAVAQVVAAVRGARDAA